MALMALMALMDHNGSQWITGKLESNLIRPHNVEACWTLQRIQQVRRRLLTLILCFWLSLIKFTYDVP